MAAKSLTVTTLHFATSCNKTNSKNIITFITTNGANIEAVDGIKVVEKNGNVTIKFNEHKADNSVLELLMDIIRKDRHMY